MRWLLRPVMLVALSAVLMLGGALVVFQGRTGSSLPPALPVAPGEYEIAWLEGATNATTWERFVTAVSRSAERLGVDQPDLKTVIGPAAYPRQSDAVPEVALQWPGGRLVFRWYKVTNEWKTRDWVDCLLQRSPPPLAIIGGNTSDAARELATQLQASRASLPEAQCPVLVLTTATADWARPEEGMGELPVAPPDLNPSEEETGGIRLSGVYAGRTFRFCFTNRQMALALTHFIWSRDDLRPDADPVQLVRWEDDIYSRDLLDAFWYRLRGLMAEESAGELAWVTGCVAHVGSGPALAGGVLPLARAGMHGSGFRLNRPLTPQRIDSSVGTFYTPNRFEAQAARYLLLDLERATAPRRPLLIVTGQSAPTRRFLRAVARTAPIQARRFVVATGDALSFNAIYRDRRVTWPVQDLPFRLVLFCHHNPIDGTAGFRADADSGDSAADDDLPGATGTEDLLLFADIVEALTRAVRKEGKAPIDASAFADRLNELRVKGDQFGFAEGGPVFNPHGNRRGGTGEHVVCLSPQFDGDRVLPRATIEVWTWRTRPDGNRVWLPVGEPLTVSYDEPSAEGGGR